MIEDLWHLDRSKSKCCNARVTKETRCSKCGKKLEDEQIRGVTGCLVAPTYVDLTDVNIPMFFEWCPADSIKDWNKSEKRATLTNGSELVFRSEDKPYKLGRGRKYDFIHLDEGRDYKDFRSAWEALYPSLADYRGKVWLTTTTNGMDVPYTMFYKPAYDIVRPKDQMALTPQEPIITVNERGDKDFSLFTWRTADNPHIPEEEVLSAKSRMSEQMWRQEFFATIESFRGLVYPDFSQEHIIKPKEMNQDDLWFVGYDDAYPGTCAAVLMVEDIKNNMYVVDEVYERKIEIPDMADKIRQMVGDRKIELYVADPSIGKEVRNTDIQGMTIRDQFVEAGISFASANNDIRPGIDRMTQLIVSNQFYVFDRCKNFIAEIGKYIWEDRKSDDEGEQRKPRKAFDHLLDACRYVIMSRPDRFERQQRDWYGRPVEEANVDFIDDTSEVVDLI